MPKRLALASLLLATCLALACSPREQAKNTYLAGLHGAKKLDCTSCHANGAALDDSESEPNKQCVSCHGELSAVAAKDPAYVAPHQSHLGNITCTTCHHAHTASQSYCAQCHSPTLAIPFADEWRPPTPPTTSVEPKVTESTDVVIVGSGGAGLTTAITAHERGAKVIVLEKQPITGGNTMLASSGMNAAGTRFQQALKIDDSPALMAQDTLTGGKNQGDPALVNILASHSADSLEWLVNLGADLSDVGLMAGSSVARTHRPRGGAAVGENIIRALRAKAAELGLDIRVNSKVVKIVEDAHGNVVGVQVLGKHRGLYAIQTKAVVVAAGGFSANPERVAHYRPEYAGMTSSNQPGAVGDGLDLGVAIDAETVGMDQIQIHPTLAAGSKTLIAEGLRGKGAVMVNHEGTRFINEMANRDVASAAVMKQTGKTAFLIFDDWIRKGFSQTEGYFHLGLVKEGATIEELATQIGVPPATLAKTIAVYNQAYEAHSDPEWQRSPLPRPISTPKYYAVEIAPGVHYTMGGLKINVETQVIGKNGAPIPGLFAVGEVTGGVHGTNRLGGNSVSETITFGRIAGANAAARALAPNAN